MKKISFITVLLIIIFYITAPSSNEVEIYADSIDQDSNGNIVAKGNVKIIDGEQILTSSIAVVNQAEKKITLPKEFRYKDEDENYYYGTSGEFSTDFETAKINNIKMLLNEGTRIAGVTGYKTGTQDLIDKGVFSPCNSKIKIKNFICPIWQVEGEKILHDRNKLFVHSKHAKMRIFNLPIYYFPYVMAPSPLRKERKSGFLSPSIGFLFLGTKSTQQIAFPYYFVLGQDKELLIKPTINYGGGVDASQHITYEYNHVLSGGLLYISASTDTNFENQNNENWLRDASIITKLKQNLNEKYHMSLTSAFQTSPTYLRRTDQNNPLNRKSTLSTTFNLNGYDVLEENDTLDFLISGYQIVRNEENNSTSPTSFPYVKYITGSRNYKGNRYKNHFNFYNIFRDISTANHAKQQQKIEHALISKKEYYSLFSKVTFRTEAHTQFYNTENKENGDDTFTGTYSRIFPMTGIFFETPIVNKKYNFYITPKLFGILNSSQSNSNKISNEDSSDYKFGLGHYNELNRYSGTDKLDNSKRLGYGVKMNKDLFSLEFGQSYEIDIERNDFTRNAGLYDHLSDLLGGAAYNGINNRINYDFRFNVDQGLMKSSSSSYTNESILGKFVLGYTQARKDTNTILETGSETLEVIYNSNDFFNYSSITGRALIDLVKDDPTNYQLGYQYTDECFGLNLDFERSFYADRDLKPKDMLTIMFSFKYLGTYASTNLAVSEHEKQEIRWNADAIEDKVFK